MLTDYFGELKLKKTLTLCTCLFFLPAAYADNLNRAGENQQFDATRNVENGGYYSYNQDLILEKLKSAQTAMTSLKRDVNQMNNGGGNSAGQGFQEQMRASYNNYMNASNQLSVEVKQARGHGIDLKFFDRSLKNLTDDERRVLPQVQGFFNNVQQANSRVVTRRDLNTPPSAEFENSRYGTPAPVPQRY